VIGDIVVRSCRGELEALATELAIAFNFSVQVMFGRSAKIIPAIDPHGDGCVRACIADADLKKSRLSINLSSHCRGPPSSPAF
jgi:uncharacterized metal-binding protein